MSGTLTITRVFGYGWVQETEGRQVGGTGQPDLTIIESYFPTAATRSGMAFDKELYGSAKDDVIVGDNSTFFIEGDVGADTLTSPRWNISGGEGDDVLLGGEGDNWLYGGAGDDAIDGGAGFDEVGFGGQGVTVDLRIVGPQQTGEGVDTLRNVEGLIGGESSDTLTGDAGSNRLTGLGGNDLLEGLGGADTIQGGDPGSWDPDFTTTDRLNGGDGDDLIFGSTGFDDISGGAGNDTINGVYWWDVDRENRLRGDGGDDQITGGASFDDINGNQGNDTVHGAKGDDWVVGGKDEDLLFGDDGSDMVVGNLGNDTLDGGEGGDVMRGGQGDDSLTGGAGNDWLSGDLGNDTLTGGAGADIFHTFGDAGIDRITDFNLAAGDRVILDRGTAYAVSQSDADTVIAMTGGQMILVGVSMASLTGDWISGA
jgi:Ca2+-binding RTX toxin-like protein